MLPTSINALVGTCPVGALEDNRTYRGLFLGEELEIQVDTSQPPSWQAATLIHEMAHLACCIARGYGGKGDDREEAFAHAMGRFLTKVLIDNPGLLDPDVELQHIDVLGEIWKVEYLDEVTEEDGVFSSWLHTRSQTMRVQKDQPPALRKLRIFPMTCEAVFQAAGIEDFDSDYYNPPMAILYALLLANPGANPRAVISDGPSE